MSKTIGSLVVRLAAALTCALVLMPSGHAQQAARPGPDAYRQLRWRHIGPEGNRFSAAAGIPGDPSTYYVGAASGGIYKTTDAGVHWQPIFDGQSVASIGSLAVAPSDPNVVWAGTGEGKLRSHISVGQGIYKSTDAGRTWTLMGLEQTGRIPRLVIDPKSPDTVLACALGHAYGPQPDRGVFRTTDGGKTWTKTLFVDENTGCSDIAMDSNNPRTLFAGMWQIEVHTWGRTSGGPGSGLYTSRDGGATWKKLTGRGLPARQVGKVAVAISQSNPNRVYALIETGDGAPWDGKETDAGQIFRSEDGGESWRVVSYDHVAMGRPHYYSRMAVAPDDEDEAYFLTASYSRTIDGGLTLAVVPRAEAPGGDHHDIWIDPTNANRMIVVHDQGLSISINRGRTWFRQRLTNAQMYHVTTDNQVPYNVFGNKQDEPTYRGPSNSRLAGSVIPRAMWHAVGGGESGFATPDPVDSNVIWSSASGSGMVGGIVVRFDEARRQFRNVEVWPDQSNGPAEGVKYRFVWDAPLLISPHDHNTIYTASQHVHRTTNGGQSWEVISPDLTLNDRSRMGSSGGLTPDNIGVEYAGVVYGLAESPKERGLIWAGTNDGLLQLTRDGGKTWTNVTKNIPSLPPWGSLRSIVASRYDAATAYLTVDFHQVNNRDPFVYKTTDYGKTFKAITSGIPKSMLSYARIICEDPVRRGLLYVGTENGIYVSFDDGENWQPLQNNLPHAPVSGITVQEHFNDLVISTYGRGFWILDDLTPLQQMTPQVLAADAHLFPPRPAYRFRPITAPSSPYDDPTIGENPPYGAAINYHLKSAPAGPVTVTILDQTGAVVRTLSAPATAGLNRMYWDLRYEPTNAIRMRTNPLLPAPHVRLGPQGWRAPSGGGAAISILAPPGTYTVKLSAGGREQTEPLTVRKDPHTAGTEADIQAQTEMLFNLRRDLNTAIDVLNRIEIVRSQLESLGRVVDDVSVRKAADDLNKTFTDLEMTLIDLRITGGQDGVRYAAKLISHFGYLANGLSNADFRPTNQQAEVQELLAGRVRDTVTRFDALVAKDLAAFNDLLSSRNIQHVVAK
ncbi:MAG: sialidase [Acidobacteria bacterium RIFCSPLOWO2_02_FULL_67_36]|nr:MAG: sialidase [Acidobacteria bacterium RIFCSPLOWO2_02_FULL_67_36]OFW20800.1 MAG: sialidase [Acidobacteria bacterium RIFCSPLOWO2_12_FULL_66_21]